MKHGTPIRVVDKPRSVWHGSGIGGKTGRFLAAHPRLAGHSMVCVDSPGYFRTERAQYMLADEDFVAVEQAA